ncbi:MAG: Glutamyl-tRNA(Gln) amidotransferase subunit A [Candidatus Uhrbacteria bacterium GW2011_GWA2_53_10]|uniref:Glutamyl-tRNA(Gln) amidotransferase subunit A n=1 Tax=Candidatus Uhrbacteria bacterium GW2011_GWA2_53_10 TaxID=1618980 RepID=A0A0G2AJG3_9BACT|nr:MAG: Glutamyl-tRNA(Gln) amidotransferase subunit A [Candidatus Uhrbacteria bacterium GW2011_GWA2_53_10]
MDTSTLTIREAAKQLAAKKISSEELVRGYLEAAKEKNEGLNALLEISDSALEAARHVDAQRTKGTKLGPLAGIPLAVKDNMLVQGWKATAGSQILESYHAVYNATVVGRLRDAGAIFLGRANMDEFAMGSSTESSHFGPTKNPWDVKRVPGGSSGGSAAAVAAGLVPYALGSDTGGSIRQPASLCGVVGLKPTYGRVSRYGLIAMASSLDQIGPITRTVEDAALVMQAIEGVDPRDATTVPFEKTVVPKEAEKSMKGLRLGIPKEYFLEGMDKKIRASVMEAIEVLKQTGASIKEISLPHTEYALAAYYINMPAEASSNLGRFDGMRYGLSATGSSLTDTYERTRGEGFGKEVQRRIMLGSYVLSAGYYDAYYRQALKVRTLISRDFEEAFKDVDAIVTPTSPSVAWKLGEKFNDPLTMYLSDIYTISMNLAGVPALSLPCGFVQNLPVGLQLIGRSFDEATLYRIGMYYQSVTDWHTKTPE